MNGMIPLQIELTNFGVLRQAQFEVGALTLVCGKNNMGKTYATYALFGFLDFWVRGYNLKIDRSYVEELVRSHQTVLPLDELLSEIPNQLKKASSEFSDSDLLSQVFGSSQEFFKGAKFSIRIEDGNPETLRKVILGRSGTHGGRVNDGKLSFVSWKTEGDHLRITLNEEAPNDDDRQFLMGKLVGECVKDAVYGEIFPRPFIACAERTGAVIFQKELDFTRNRLVEMIGDQKAERLSPLRFFQSFTSRYPLPIRRNVDAARNIPEEKQSFLAISKDPRCSEILGLFCEIIGGRYKVVRGEMRFVPLEGKQVQLDMVLSSSSVRALMHLGVYLFYLAKPGDMLLMDEPEQNLHPENQRKMARLLAMLANSGVRVFITTHSDYIVRELNTLIMLSSGNPFAEEVRKKYHYRAEDGLKCETVRVYCAEKAMMPIPGKKRKVRANTLVKADIEPRQGIDARMFDDTINEMNEIQQELYWPEEESDE